MSELADISRFRWLTVWLADNLVPEDVHKVQTLLKDYLKGSNTGDDALAIFDFLVKQHRIHDEDTGLLRTLFISLGRMDLLEAVNDYEREKTTVARRLGRNSSNVGGPYFGRHDSLNKLITILDTSYDHIHGIYISGDAGIGKTRLALEACARMRGSHNLVTVDLHGLPSVENVYYAVMHAFGVTCREFDLDNLYGFLRGYENTQYGSTILLLDNANSVLDSGSIGTANPVYEKFVDTVKTILDISNPRLKIIMTSRFNLDIGSGLSSKTISELRLNQYNGLDTDAAVRMLRYHAGNTPISYEDAKTVADECGNNPMCIKVLSSRLQDGKSHLTDILPTRNSNPDKVDISDSLSHLRLSQNDRLNHCLKPSFKSLPKKHRANMIKLSTIRGAFSLEVARKVYRQKDLAMLQYDLHHLKYLGLLEKMKIEPSNQFSGKLAPYKVPVALRDFIVAHVKSEGGEDLKTFHKAQNKCVEYFGKKLRNICKLLQTDSRNGLSRLQQDAMNYLGFIDIIKIADDFKPSKNLWWVILAIERLLSPSEAVKMYSFMSLQAKQRGDIHAYADLRCHEIMQLKELEHDVEELLQRVVEVQDILNQKLDSSVDIRSKQFSLANCYCLRGELLTRCNKPLEAVQWLQQAVSLRKQVLGGDHYLIARALNSLGVAVMKGASPGSSVVDINAEKTKAKTILLQAYEMCRRLANGSDKHLDIPRYIADIGDILRELGEHEDAIECMNRGVELESALGMGGAVATCAMQEQIVMSYCDMERFEDAIPVAKKLMEHRKKLSGPTTPESSHVMYLLGSTYLKARNYQEAKTYLTEALEIEEALWGKGLPHSDDWLRLKTGIETMMVTLQKQSALTSYRKRFQDADDLSLRGRLLQSTGYDDDSDNESDRSSQCSENEDELPASDSSENSDELPASLSSENSDELPDFDDSSEDEGPVTRKLVRQDSDDDTSSNSSSLRDSENEFPLRVDRNLNHMDKEKRVEPLYKPGSKESSPSGSSGVGSSDEMTRDLTPLH